MMTLWDLIEPVVRRVKPRRPVVAPPPAPVVTPAPVRRPAPRSKKGAEQPVRTVKRQAKAEAGGMQAKYDAVVAEMLEVHQIRVRKWRTSMSGIAWYVTYKDGRIVRLIEAPRPKGPMSAAVFLHEVGHHAIGFDTYKPRCLEEYHAWAWALGMMDQKGLNITDAVRRRMHASLWYAVQKAKRRGIRSVPEELTPFLERPERRRSA